MTTKRAGIKWTNFLSNILPERMMIRKYSRRIHKFAGELNKLDAHFERDEKGIIIRIKEGKVDLVDKSFNKLMDDYKDVFENHEEFVDKEIIIVYKMVLHLAKEMGKINDVTCKAYIKKDLAEIKGDVKKWLSEEQQTKSGTYVRVHGDLDAISKEREHRANFWNLLNELRTVFKDFKHIEKDEAALDKYVSRKDSKKVIKIVEKLKVEFNQEHVDIYHVMKNIDILFDQDMLLFENKVKEFERVANILVKLDKDHLRFPTTDWESLVKRFKDTQKFKADVFEHMTKRIIGLDELINAKAA